MRAFKRSVILVVVLSLIALAVAGCNKPAQKKKITLGYVSWAEGIAMTHLLEAIIEDKLGYEVETAQADVGVVFTGVAKGDYDAFVDTWLPVTHESYMAKVKDQVDNYGTVYEGARIGLVVPAYVNINSIEEMNPVKDKFKGKIIGIDAGAGIMKATNKAIQEYGLDYELVASSEAAMTASLKDAIDKNEWVVVTGWTPHWMFARWDLKFLEDPKGVYGAAERIDKIARKGLEKDAPEVARLLKNFKMNDQQLGVLEGYINEGMEPVEAGRRWMKENADVVESWLK
ncbi:MAG: glycine betaine/proline transport system substrate-binding protein [Moorella sp. (in: firmicutes)]|nr:MULTISPECIES: glycine betaine ABC transporter substrate-binding protein [unclassified Moorella (in: firmicutes)]MDK2815952.1 glycine betaine/proline transport system substrate-binding protein [Moorella sp. (in: firmicutes)]MDK2894933.1 glycine betaine/proline transport system substrate-binding protein [Moorella sp. (in: firmicutes)]GEA13959.1 ABC transporter substrate-binding protein [Moorella sp. E308F]GEA18668.1 ABC transporter substrate-binding protein [Moorella sp. E306M]